MQFNLSDGQVLPKRQKSIYFDYCYVLSQCQQTSYATFGQLVGVLPWGARVSRIADENSELLDPFFSGATSF